MSEAQAVKGGSGQTDVAALGSGVVGVAVAILIQPGAFTPLVAIISATLGLVIFSYIWGHRRSGFQQVAFASVIGVLAMPVIGTILEPEWDAMESRVAPEWLFGAWIVAGLITFAFDTVHQRRLTKG